MMCSVSVSWDDFIRMMYGLGLKYPSFELMRSMYFIRGKKKKIT